MFGARKGVAEGEPSQENPVAVNRSESVPSRAVVDVSASPSPRMAVAERTHATPQRVNEIPREIPRAASRRAHSFGESDSRTVGDGTRTLRVGKGLSVAGEITACDVLIVEGKVEAKLNDGKMLEIAESGQFRGSVEIENADIAGRYDGQLVVHGRLIVRSTGRVSGMVKYGELEVNAGGQIIGEVQVAGAGAATAPPPSFKNAGKFAPSYTEEADEQLQNDRHNERHSERRSA